MNNVQQAAKNREAMMKLLKKTGESPPFSSGLINKIRFKLDYSATNSDAKIAGWLQKAYLKMNGREDEIVKQHRMRSVTLGGHRPKKDPETIAKLDTYTFKSDIAREAFNDEEGYLKFVKTYLNIARAKKVTRYFVPTPFELQIFQQFESKEIDFQGFAEKLNLNSTTAAQKLGRMYVYSKSNTVQR